MFEFVFFHPVPQQMFIDWLKEKGLQPQGQVEDEVYTVLLAEDDDMDEDLYDAIEDKYDDLREMNEAIMREENADQVGYHMAGIAVQLSDGRTSYADVDPRLVARVMECVSPEEFTIIVDAIVTAVETPQELTYCQRQRREQETE